MNPANSSNPDHTVIMPKTPSKLRRRLVALRRATLIGSVIIMTLVLAVAAAYIGGKAMSKTAPVGFQSSLLFAIVLPVFMCIPIGVAIAIFEWHRRRGRQRQVIACTVCGYPLTGAPVRGPTDAETLRCPECGEDYTVTSV